ncbi:linker for activation of T-cells family member 2 isoform X5 [Arvicanthis niloticus]|uniref:linker for activation of T-cells family member 2 isoform X5 n=1 Tax=Arvicanthis niloticus TaxID=61156 RepID=UPI00402BCC9A
MSAALELLWLLWLVSGLSLLLLLGATAWLCVHCSRPGVKRNEKIYEQRNQKNKLLFSHLEGPESPRYQNFYKGSRDELDSAYVDPISTDYYNWGRFQKPPEDDDSNSYENVLICKPSTPESGVEESEDYQNSVSIHQWRESKRIVGAQRSLSGSPDEEPDYVNGDVAAAEKI